MTNFLILFLFLIYCFAITESFKMTNIPTKFLPLISIVTGIIIGAVIGITAPLTLAPITLIDAILSGALAGLMAPGLHSLFKNLDGSYEPNQDCSLVQEETKKGI